MTHETSVGSPRRANLRKNHSNMNMTNKLLGLSLAAFMGFACSTFADEGDVGTHKKSLESRIAELEAKLKDAGVSKGVKGSGIKISGYVDTSYLVNLADRDNTAPVAGSSNQNTGRVFDNQFNAFDLNAFKLTIQKDKDTSKYPAGFRVDTIVGEDANVLKNAKAAGVTGFDSDLYLEQAFIDLGIPAGNGVDVKVGKMTSLIGFEAIESPANWQFSRSDGFRLSPKTQTGLTAGYQCNDNVNVTVGVINGFDSLSGAAATSGAINYNIDVSFVGRVDVTGPKTSYGNFNAFTAGFYGNDETSGTATALSRPQNFIWEIGGAWNKPFEIKPLGLGIDYIYRESDISTAAAAAGLVNLIRDVNASAVSAYGKWDWNKWLTTSARFSFTDYGNIGGRAAGGGIAAVAGSTLSPLVLFSSSSRETEERLYSITLTQAFNVWKDTLVRLEFRHDWTDSTTSGFGAASATAAARDDIRNEQDTIAVNVVYSF